MKRHLKAAAGFTLVELIVVIAILGILAGVAVPTYSGYVKKANMASDQSLVNDVVNALQLAYYANGGSAERDYVILTTETSGATEDGFADKAMTAVFGENWRNTALLKYDGWAGDDVLADVRAYNDEELELIADSSIMKYSTPEGMMGAVVSMTDIVSEVVKGSDLSKASERIEKLLGTNSHTANTLSELELDPNNPEYSTVLSNLLVNEMSGRLQNAENDNNNLTQVLFLYSTMFAYEQATGDSAPLNQFKTNLTNIQFETLTQDTSMKDCLAYCVSGIDSTKLQEYGAWSGATQDEDLKALKTMMGAVKTVSGNFKDLETLSNSQLYTSSDVSESVNNYVNAVKGLASMDQTARDDWRALDTGAVTAFIGDDGTVSVIPNAVWLRGE